MKYLLKIFIDFIILFVENFGWSLLIKSEFFFPDSMFESKTLIKKNEINFTQANY